MERERSRDSTGRGGLGLGCGGAGQNQTRHFCWNESGQRDHRRNEEETWAGGETRGKEVGSYLQNVLLCFGTFGGSAHAGGGGEAQDLGDGQRLLPLLPALAVDVLLLEVAHHDVVVDLALLCVVTLVDHHQRHV